MTQQRILAGISREDFIARDAELKRIARQASHGWGRPGLLLLAAPRVGAGELLRQSYDELFARRADAIPIHLSFGLGETIAEVARQTFHTSIQQYIAYRRVDPLLCKAALTLHELAELAPAADYELISELLESFERERTKSDERAFLRFCLGTFRRLNGKGRGILPLIDCTQLSAHTQNGSILGRELADLFREPTDPFVLAGLRRQILDVMHGASDGHDSLETIHLEKLNDDDTRTLIDRVARRNDVDTNEPTRDLIAQQVQGSPSLINSLIQAARETKSPLTSFLNCQRVYVDELMGGRLGRYFANVLDQIAPHPQTRRTLLRVLHESASVDSRRSSLWSWKKRLGVDAAEFEKIIDAMHVHELANSSAAFIEVNSESYVWMDYLRAHYRLDVSGEPRALVVANTLLESLKRAPQTMTRKYRSAAALGLRDLLAHFSCQRVPASLFHYDRFAKAHKGLDAVAVDAALDAEADLLRLPQIVYTADCAALTPAAEFENERCAVGHGFEAADYSDENETVWLAAELDSKLEATEEMTEEWCNRLAHLARECGLDRVQLWLVAPEGFSPKAVQLLNKRGAYGSSRRQIELLTARIKDEVREDPVRADDYEMIIPMGGDTELIAANTVEQIARRLKFHPEAINQLKTAVVEACINAAEHSLSTDRKIYQRFHVERDKLVVTVASRGVVPANITRQNGESAQPEGKSRRGWGLKLIRTLMDEVEFERVDDGTRLRMTKYIR
jgi:serine/threonine-protein kinase RsbW